MPKLHLLGGFTLLDDVGTPALLPKKARGLVAYLAMADGRPVAREKLATLLWESSSEEQARASLRQALAAVRRAAGDLIHAEADHLQLAPAAEVDARTFLNAEESEAAAMFSGDLLDGFALSESGFASWLAAERARVRDRAITCLERVATDALAARRHDQALAAGQKLVALDPLHEGGQRLLMRAYAESGRVGEALRQYRGLQAMLRRELGAAPEPETVALAAELAGRRRGSAEPERPEPELEPAAPAMAVEPEQTSPPARRELRRVAVLSVSVAGFASMSRELDLEELQEMMAAAHAVIDDETAKAGGMILERQADRATLLFGVSLAHDDDPVRAAAVALQIHERLAADPVLADRVEARIGISAGPLLISEAGGATTAFGEAMTVAPLLRAAAGRGAVLAPASLMSELGTRFATEPAGEVEGVRAHRIIAPAPDCCPPPMSGRDTEAQQIANLLAAVSDGEGRTLCLRGEAGLGKSRLALAASEAAREMGFRVLRAEIADFGERAAVTPRRQMLRAMLGLGLRDEVPERLGDHPLARRLDGDELALLFQLLGARAPAGTGTGRPAPANDREAADRRDRLFGRMLGILAEEQPLLLLVEDAHWAEPDVRRQMQELSRHIPTIPALLLITTRPDPDPFDQAWRAGAGPMVTLDLAPLGKRQSVEVAQAFGAISMAEAEACAARANGNPLFLQQLVAAVREGISPDDALPGSVQGLTVGRMDRLEKAEREALRAAAVLGQRADIEAVRFVAAQPDYCPSPAALGQLLLSDGDTMGFVHALVRDAVRSTITWSEQRRLHRRAADWYRGRDLELHASHLSRAGDTGAGAAWADAAAAALARHRPDKAVIHVEKGLAAARVEDRARLRLIAAQARMRLLDAEGAIADARAAREAATTDAERVQALSVEADAQAAGQQSEAALELLDEAESIAAPAGLAEAMARILSLKGNIHFPRGALEECLEAHGGALVWSRRAGTPLAEAGALLGLAWAHYQRGDFGTATARASECLMLADGKGFDRIRLSAFRVRSVSRIFLLEHAEALADAEAAIELAARQGDAINEILARTTAGTVHLERWHHEAAIAIAEPALALTSRIQGLELEAAPLWVLGTARGVAGSAEEAVKLLQLARAAGMRGTAIRFAVPRILGTLAFFTDPKRREALVSEGEAMLSERTVAHSALGLYGSALHASLVFGEHDLCRRCEAGIARYGGETPEPWAEAMLTMARTFGAVSAGTASAQDHALADAFHTRARHTTALGWLRPTMRIVERRAGLRQPA